MAIIQLLLLQGFIANFSQLQPNKCVDTFLSAVTSKSTPKPIDPEGWPQRFPAKSHCSKCGLCETTFVQHVSTSCAFLGDGMGRIDSLEQGIHNKSRLNGKNIATASSVDIDAREMENRFGILHEQYPIMLVKGTQKKAQWTGAVTSIAIAMLEHNLVDAVVCIGASSNALEPQPIIAKSVDEILRGRGVKPSLAPSLQVLDEIKKDASIKKLLFCGVGCAVQSFRSDDVQQNLGLERVYVLGTNCADNSPSVEASQRFISSGLNIKEMSNVKGYEFMQDFQVHVKLRIQDQDKYEKIPYFSLPGKIARASIADSCLACFDYTNALADVVVGYMGAPLDNDMDSSLQTLTIRNDSGKEMVEIAVNSGKLSIHGEAKGKGSWQDFAVQTVAADSIVEEMVGKQPKEEGLPRLFGKIMAKIIQDVGPKGLNFASYSIDYHTLRNYLHVVDQWGEKRAETHMPTHSKNIVNQYLQKSKTFRSLKESILERKRNINSR